MKKIVFVLIAFIVICCSSCDNKEKVYICAGGSSKCYHESRNCHGLSRCSKEIKNVTISEAEKQGRRPCKICYSE